jgi:heat shock protein HslJ
MRHRVSLLNRVPLLIGLAAMLGGCSLVGDDTANGGLVDTSWTVLSVAGQATLPDARPTMTFAQDATVSGTGGCNQYTGSFRTDGDRITVGPVSSTLMGCEGQRGQQETAFLAGLQGATTWRQGADGNLVLEGAGEIVAQPGVAEGSADALPSNEAMVIKPG